MTLSTEVLEMVAWYATKALDPESEISRAGNDEVDLLNLGINSSRGTAAESMANLIRADPAKAAFYGSYLSSMVQDTSAAVRACVALTLNGLMWHDRDLAVKLFLELCDTEDVLLSTRHIEMFLMYGLPTHFSELQPILLRMIESDIQEVATNGARQVCLASLTMEQALPLARRCVSGSSDLRLGAAEVYSANLRNSTYRSDCEDMLATLFSDEDEEIRNAAAMCFNGFEGQELGEYEELIEAYVQSPAFSLERDFLIHALGETTAYMPESVLIASERFLDVAGRDAGDIQTSSASYSDVVSKLVIRVYSRSTDSGIRSRCLDLNDRMMSTGVYGLEQAMMQIDR